MSSELFLQLSVFMLVAAIIGLFFRRFKQPTIIGDILAGFLVGSLFFSSFDSLLPLAEVGIALILFSVGLELDLSKIRKLAFVSSIFALVQLAGLGIVGFIASSLLGFSVIEAFYIGVALSFSSTMVAVRLYQEKNVISSIQARICIGILIVQDLVSVIILSILPSITDLSFASLSTSLFKGVILVIVALAISIIVRREIGRIKSYDMIFLFSLAIFFGFSLLSYVLDYSFAVGAFIGGLILGSTTFNYEISSKINSLSEFFATIFFIILGINLSTFGFDNLGIIIADVLLFSALVLFFAPLLVIVLMRLFKYHLKTSFFVGTAISQISEFSLIVISTGFALGHVGEDIVAIIVGVAAVTIPISAYVIKNDEAIYNFLFRSKSKKRKEVSLKRNSVILFGAGRSGSAILLRLKEFGSDVFVIDLDPSVIKSLKKRNISCIYGDGGNLGILSKVPFNQSNIVISTVPSLKDNLAILTSAKKVNPGCVVICTSNEIEDSLKLYSNGADYVVVPHVIAGEQIIDLLIDFDGFDFLDKKFKNIKDLHKKKAED